MIYPLYYTGVGSRNTPSRVGKFMRNTATYLETEGFILRSGGAAGADTYFESGVKNPDNARIYLAEPGMFGHPSQLSTVSPEAMAMAKTIHPRWNAKTMIARNELGRRLHARNCNQVLGCDLMTPSRFLICWTEDGKDAGGTRTAIILARRNNIPVLNLGSITESEYMDALIALMEAAELY